MEEFWPLAFLGVVEALLLRAFLVGEELFLQALEVVVLVWEVAMQVLVLILPEFLVLLSHLQPSYRPSSPQL